jgi:hypothetical protein
MLAALALVLLPGLAYTQTPTYYGRPVPRNSRAAQMDPEEFELKLAYWQALNITGDRASAIMLMNQVAAAQAARKAAASRAREEARLDEEDAKSGVRITRRKYDKIGGTYDLASVEKLFGKGQEISRLLVASEIVNGHYEGSSLITVEWSEGTGRNRVTVIVTFKENVVRLGDDQSPRTFFRSKRMLGTPQR